MTVLLDTNVISELRRPDRIPPIVRERLDSLSQGRILLSAITIEEIERGVLLLERKDAAQGSILRDWLEGHVLDAFAGRIVPVDTGVARQAAALQVDGTRRYADALIAASAMVHGATLITRDTQAVADIAGLVVLDPWGPSA